MNKKKLLSLSALTPLALIFMSSIAVADDSIVLADNETLDLSDGGKTIESSIDFNVTEGNAYIEGGSIVSVDSTSSIEKTGAGSLDISSDMSAYLGTLEITEGTLHINNGLGSNDIDITSAGTLYLTNSTISGATSSAIYNSGTAYLGSDDANAESYSLNFSNNKSTNGAAIFNTSGSLELVDVMFSSNEATKWGGAIYNTGSSSTISILNSSFYKNTAVSHGGAIYNASGTISSIDNSNFTSNKSTDSWGGAIFNKGTINEVLSSTFTSNTASIGGAIANDSGALYYVKDSIFESNVATYSGGAIYNEGGTAYDTNGKITEISGNTFTTNVVTGEVDNWGGAIANYGGVDSENGYVAIISLIDDNIFTGNTIIYGWGGAIANINNAKIETISNNTFTSNKAYAGGAIANIESSLIELISNNEFIANEASFGGAIMNNSSEIYKIEDTLFSGNVSTTSAGAIMNEYGTIGSIGDDTASLVLNEGDSDSYSVIFSSNKASYGGAIYNDSSSDIGTILNTLFYKNTSSSYGGAIANYGTITSIEGSKFVENSNSSRGGAIYNAGTIGSIIGSYSSDDDTSSDDYVFDFDTNSGSWGGAIRNLGTIEAIKDTSFGGNSASYGGAIQNDSLIELIDSSYFYNNTAKSTYGGAIYNVGTSTTNQVYITTISDTIFENNTAATYGGAIFNKYATISTITGTTFTDNTATSMYGGAIYNEYATIIEISSSTFEDNTASYGGAIFNNISSTIGSIANVSFNGNTASSYGGAIYNVATITSMTNVSFEGNTAKNSSLTYTAGGAIYNSGTITGDNIAFDSNYVYGSGGAIYNLGTLTLTSDVTFTGNKANIYYDNSVATAGKGGAIYNYYSDVTIGYNALFSGNSAYNGGAIYNLGGTLSIGSDTATMESVIEGDANYYSAIFYDNTANTTGGAIYNLGTIKTISNTLFYDNTASNFGGAIINVSAKIGTITGSTFKDNEATYYYGGAIYNEASTIDEISNSTFEDNTANYGGAIFNHGTSTITSITNTSFEGNKATTDGGAIYNNGTIENISNATFDNNNSASYGGAIMNWGEITLTDTTFSSNEATTSGGAIYNSKTLTYITSAGTAEESNDIINVGNTASYGGFLYSASDSTTTFNTGEYSSITIGNGTVNQDSIHGTGTIVKEGLGTLTVNSSMESFTGSLSVDEGTMAVNNILGATSITIDEDATLSMGITTASLVGADSSVAVFSSSSSSDFSFSNSGTLSLVATVGLADNSTYTVFANGNVDITNITTFGGTVALSSDSTSVIFSVSEAKNLVLNAENANVTVGASDRVAVASSSDSDSSYTAVYLAFSSDATSKDSDNSSVITVASVTANEAFVNEYVTTLETADSILASAAYDFVIDLESGSVMLSMYVGVEDYDVSQFTIYHSEDGTDWDTTNASNVTYDGTYVSFEVSGFSTFGYTVSAASAAVPEPSTYAMIIGLAALGFAAYRRRK